MLYGGPWGHFSLDWPIINWHGHEMLYGFTVAAIAGFLSAAVPKWTGGLGPHLTGRSLVLLVGTWIAGRGCMLAAGMLPPLLVAIVDLSFIPLLIFHIAGPIFRARKVRNYGFPFILTALWSGNVALHAQQLGIGDFVFAKTHGLYVTTYMILLMIAIIGGRIIPPFTRNALRLRGIPYEIRRYPWIEWPAFASLIALAVVDLVAPTSPIKAVPALVAAILFTLRAALWLTRHLIGDPIVWILHVGHAWIPVGLWCVFFAERGGAFPLSTSFHAFTAGAIGTMILAVASRAALGHTGRELTVSGLTRIAYWLVILGAALRVFGPWLSQGLFHWPYQSILWAAAGLWSTGYLLFSVAYWPILTRPRYRRKSRLGDALAISFSYPPRNWHTGRDATFFVLGLALGLALGVLPSPLRVDLRLRDPQECPRGRSP